MENIEKKTPLNDLMDTTMDKIRDMVDSNTIIGEPITTPDGVTVIPVSRVSFGFGAGGLVLGHGGLLGLNFGGQTAGIFLMLGYGGGQSIELQRGAQPFGGSIHALGLGAGELGGKVIHLGLAGFQLFFSIGTLVNNFCSCVLVCCPVHLILHLLKE